MNAAKDVTVFKPRNYVLVMLDICMLKCKICHQWKSFQRENELTIEEWKSFIDSLKYFIERPSKIHLVGGEPLMKEGILDLVEYIGAYKDKFMADIVTNAVLITDEIAKRVVDSGLSTIILSLDSLKPEIHDYLRGKKGCYLKVMEALDLLERYRSELKKPIDIGIQSVILEHNVTELVQLVKFAEEDKRIQFISLQALKQPLNSPEDERWYKSDEFSFLWPKDNSVLNESIEEIIALKRQGSPKISNEISQLELYKSYYRNPEAVTGDIRCNIFNQVAIIDPVGNLSFCSRTGEVGNIRNKPLGELWVSKEAEFIRNRVLTCKNICRDLMFNYSYEDENKEKGEV